MEAPFWNLFVLITLLSLTVSLLSKILLLFNPKTRPIKPPPGPKPWPLIGNLNLLGSLPHQSLHKLSQKYGPIMQLKFGSFPVVVASSAETAKLFLQTYDHIFASRPKTAAGKYIAYNYSNITWTPYGPYWRQGRKIFFTQLFSAKRLKSYEYIRIEEMHTFVSKLFAASGKPVKLKEHLCCVTLSIISRIVLGKKYVNEMSSLETSGESEAQIVELKEFQEMLDELFLLSGLLNIGDWIPWLCFLDLQGYEKRMKAVKKWFNRFYDHVLYEHKAKKDQEDEVFVVKDMVDLLLELADNPDLEVKLSYDGVKAFTQDLIAGGTDTSATTVEWAISELVKQPCLIEKATAELDRVVGSHRWVAEKDIPQLPFIDAIVKETMRKHPVVALLVPHLAQQDCRIGGYDLREGTRVFINTWSIGRDPSVWDQPDEFRPERFLENPKLIDVKGQSFELLPFGSGRRMCPGYSLGLIMITSIVANLLHGFRWKLPEGVRAEDLDMEELSGLVTVRKNPLVVVVEPRLPAHLYNQI